MNQTQKNQTAIQELESDQRRIRREALAVRALDGLRETIQLRGMTPETQVENIRADFTDASVRYIAQLIEAVLVLEEIIFASDGCEGHRDCVHSMEPWQRARALLQPKWEADTGERDFWPDVADTTPEGP
jgi:hypothetical protein